MQSEENLEQKSGESDDVFSPSPGTFSSRMFSFSPERIHGLQQGSSESNSQKQVSPSREVVTSAPVTKPMDLSSTLTASKGTYQYFVINNQNSICCALFKHEF